MPEPSATDEQTTAAAPGSRKMLFIAMATLLLAGGGGAWWFLSEPDLTPPQKLDQALKMIGPERPAWEMRQALKIADELQEMGYVDPDFPAGISYIRGMAAFHEGRQFDGEEQQRRLITAVEHFDLALPRGMPLERKSELTWAAGIALQTVGLSNRARDYLRDASGYGDPDLVVVWEPGTVEASLLYMQSLINGQIESELNTALRVNDDLVANTSLSEAQQRKIALQRAQILHQLGRREEAGHIIAETPDDDETTIILRARAVMSEAQELAQDDAAASIEKYNAAQGILSGLTGAGSPAGPAGQALFLTGLCAERLGNLESAINYYEQAVRRYGERHEWLASSLRLANLLRQSGRNEESLQAYRSVLRSVSSPDDFRNRWLTVEQFRESILLAWRAWLEQKQFEEAQSLSHEMSPLIDRASALRYVARTAEQWAMSVEADARPNNTPNGPMRRVKIRQRWTASGDAYATLADSIRTEADYPDIIWTSAQHYGRGYAFEQALDFTNQFIRSEPTEGLARAWVFKGRMLLNLDRLPDAYESLQFVVTSAPTDPSVFEARFLSGRCQLEMDQPDAAEQTWRDILNSEELTPSANEWRLSKFELGRLLVRKAANEYRKSQVLDGAEPTDEQLQLKESAFTRWKEAIQHLGHYLERYPFTDESVESRYLLARALQRAAIEPRERLDDTLPANARTQLQRELVSLLTRAVDQYYTLQDQLSSARFQGELNAFQEQIFRATFMQIPHALFELGRYAEALAQYRIVTSRFADHVSVLPAYVQMARCFRHLGQPDESRRQLEQARIILRRLPDEAFTTSATGLTREQWNDWIEWARRVHAVREQA